MRGLRDWWRLFRPAALAPNGGQAMTLAPERSFGGRRILVTGGAGLRRRAPSTQQLVDAGARVTVLDDLFTGMAETIPTGAEFVQGSVTDEKLVDELVAANSLVFHLAARNIIASTANPRDDFETNIGGTLNVLMAARASKVDRVVYTSSASVYGNPREIPINEDDGVVRCRRTPSASSAASTTARRSTRATGCRRLGRRYSNIYGPGQRPDNPYCGVVCKFLVEPTPGGRCLSTATASRPATTRTSTTRSRRRSWPRPARAPRARSSTSGPASRPRSTDSP